VPRAPGTLWTTPAGSCAFQLPLPENLDELAARVASELADSIAERLRPYCTKVTAEILLTPVS
jgi:hypothetical protein